MTVSWIALAIEAQCDQKPFLGIYHDSQATVFRVDWCQLAGLCWPLVPVNWIVLAIGGSM